MSIASSERPRQVSPPTTALVVYIAACCGLAALALVIGWRHHPLSSGDWVGLAVLLALGVTATTSGTQDLGIRVSLNFAMIVLVAAVAIVGPFGTALVGLTAYLFEFHRRPLRARFFNAAMTSLLGAAGGWVYLAVGGDSMPSTPGGLGGLPAESSDPVHAMLQIAVPLMVADLVICVVNAVLLAGVLRLGPGRVPVAVAVKGRLAAGGVEYVGYGVLGVLLVILWWPAGLGLFSVLLVLPPLFVARWALVQFDDEQRAHQRTLSALVTAAEVKEGRTRGHSERVASLCELIARTLRLADHEMEALSYAALLHDIGKLGLPPTARVGSSVADADLETVATHSVRGVDMLRDIEFLQGSFDGILHHHERFDGYGYPVGLAGDDIPLQARIIAVADAFDALTTAGPDRQARTAADALRILHQRAGTHLDPALVGALDRALSQQGWQPPTSAENSAVGNAAAFNHDDPAVSDVIAGQIASARRVRRAVQRPMPS